MAVMWLVGCYKAKTSFSHVLGHRKFVTIGEYLKVQMTSCAMCYDVFYHPSPINCQYLNTSGVDSPANSRCRLLSCFLAVLAMLLANSLPTSTSSSWNGWNVWFLSLPKQLNLVPRSISVNGSIIWQFCCMIDVIFHVSQSSSKFGWQ